MACNDSPSLSIAGTVDYCTAISSCPTPLSITLGEVTAHEPMSVTIDGGGTKVIAPGSPPANFFQIITVQPIRVVLDGGSEFIPVTRSLIITGDVTSVILHNDVVASPKDIQVDIVFATGVYL